MVERDNYKSVDVYYHYSWIRMVFWSFRIGTLGIVVFRFSKYNGYRWAMVERDNYKSVDVYYHYSWIQMVFWSFRIGTLGIVVFRFSKYNGYLDSI